MHTSPGIGTLSFPLGATSNRVSVGMPIKVFGLDDEGQNSINYNNSPHVFDKWGFVEIVQFYDTPSTKFKWFGDDGPPNQMYFLLSIRTQIFTRP